MVVIHKKVWGEYAEATFWPKEEVEKYGFQIIQFELKELAESQKEIADGKGKILKSLKDLR